MAYRFSFSVLLLTLSLHAQWFFANSAFVGSGFSSNLQTGVKVYVQHDAYPALALSGGYTYFNWVQPGVTYTQSGTDFLVGVDQNIHQNTLSLGLNLTLFAKNSFYIDVAASYYLLQELTFGDPVKDASFPTSGYNLELGVGYNLGYWSFRPYYSFISFADDYIVLNQVMLPLTQQHTFGLELIYWY